MRHTRLFAGAGASALTSFAHLLGGATPRGRAEDDQPPGKEDEDAKKARRAEEDERRREEDARRAEEDDRRKDEDARRAEEDEEDQGGDEQPGGKKKGEGGDNPQDDDTEDKEAKGRKAERQRWTSVLGHANAGGRVASACTLLSGSDHDAAAIVATLATLPKDASGGGLRELMALVPNPDTGRAPPRGGGTGAGASPAKSKAHAFLASAYRADPSRVSKPE